MRGTTRAARRRSSGDNSDELDFVAKANCSLCISQKLRPEDSGEQRHQSKARATPQRTKATRPCNLRRPETQEKDCTCRLSSMGKPLEGLVCELIRQSCSLARHPVK